MVARNQTVISWFNEAPLPPIFGDPAVIVGGTSLLREFLARVAETRRDGRLTIAVPFIGPGLAAPALWEEMDHRRIDLQIVTRGRTDAADAQRYLAKFPWRSMEIRRLPGLHAKLYIFQSRGTSAVLVGSHNLSRNASRNNHEAGVLFVSRCADAVAAMISNVCEAAHAAF